MIASGDVHVMEELVATRVLSRPHAPIAITGSRNVSIAATDDQGVVAARLYMGESHWSSISVSGGMSWSWGRGSVMGAHQKDLIPTSGPGIYGSPKVTLC